MLSISYQEEEAAMPENRDPPPLPRLRQPKSRLHNFSFPTANWGSTRLFRCSKPAYGSAAGADPKPASAPAPAPPPAASADEEASSTPARPWNLRTRRSACSAPGEKESGSPPMQVEKRTVRLRSEDAEKGAERRKFSVQLSREEIEEDFYAFKGTKPPRRPKKRPRIVQRQLEALYPAFWLTEVTLDAYKTTD